MQQTLLETGARASELVQFRIEDVSLAERVITVRRGKSGRLWEVPVWRDLIHLLRLLVGARRAGPLLARRQQGSASNILIRQDVGQVARDLAEAAGITSTNLLATGLTATSGVQ